VNPTARCKRECASKMGDAEEMYEECTRNVEGM
jgi:hypothetical protein